MNSNKMFFFFILIFSTFISISANSWMGCWIGLEINLLSFIPLISNSKNLFSSEASLKYFLVQSIASINFLFSILLKMIMFKNFEINNLFSILINSSMFMKMGSAPFHFWFPNIIEGMSWMNCFILMSWQKITPMILMSYYLNNNFLMLIMMINTIIGAIGGINQTSLRKLMSFSSINNLGWMMLAIMISESLWFTYFFFYSFLMSIMCFLFYIMNIYFINQLFIFNMNFLLKFIIDLMNSLSMGSITTFFSICPKMILTYFHNFSYILNIFLSYLFYWVTTLFFYYRIIYSRVFFFFSKKKSFKIFLKNKFFSFFMFFGVIFIMGKFLSAFFFF
uniref:NADH-ubiquinone oxidoreductase chain 2 n=1 Tax=Tapena vasava TaxID=1006002 RepID=I1SSH2_TAPVA|nr:NADH dehydrogenase subunit 2 [Ctenoptilum vasava]AEB71602.1 NADH dehydrogenase subunit 2 [Ctenoptilum vasava]